MLNMDYEILIGGRRLGLLTSVTVRHSVETLTDTATIIVPASYLNRTLNLEKYIKEGEWVQIELGYNGNLQTEFKGYLKTIKTDDKNITLECEDPLYLFRTQLKDQQLQSITLKTLLQHITQQVNQQQQTNYTINCDYTFTYKKITISCATAIDVLKKIQDETKANIYVENNTLHIHPPYSKMNPKPINFNFAVNVQQSELKYVKAKDKNIKIEIKTTLPDGTEIKAEYGTENGQTKTRKVSAATQQDLLTLAKNEYNLLCYDGYEGSLTAWLVPYCQPTDQIKIIDADYPQKEGCYYVIATEVNFNSNGATRKITIGRRTK